MKDQKDDHRKDITVPGMLTHVTLHKPHCIIKGRNYLPTFRAEKCSFFKVTQLGSNGFGITAVAVFWSV